MKPASILSAFLFVCLTAAAQAENILDNAKFSRLRPDGSPADWIYFLPGSSHGLARANESNIVIDPTVTHNNSKAVRISSDKPVRCSLLQQNIPLAAGQKVRVSVWVKGQDIVTDSKKGAWVRLGFGNRNDAAVQKEVDAQTVFLKADQSTFDWKKFQSEVEIPAGTNRVSLDLFLWYTTGTVWYAEPSVEVIGGPASVVGTKEDFSGKNIYSEANRTLSTTGANEKRVVFIGDSITAKWALHKSFPGKAWINRGISGQMTAEIYDRFESDVLALHPKVVVLLAGTNDIANGISQDSSLANIRGMIQDCKNQKIKVLVESLLPVSDYHSAANPQFEATLRRPLQQIIEFNKALEQACHELGANYLNLHSALVDSLGQLPADLSNDGLHPNNAGYAKIAPLVDSEVKRLLGE
jgi:lysophospholipase L1-like esterase